VENLDQVQVPIPNIFINQVAPLKATWYSGTLHVIQGKMLQYVHAEFASEFERDLCIEIQDGRVTGETIKENKPPDAEKPKRG